ncbi:MAG: diguanylate cyclase [Burkholderiaceae bacterium]
MLDHFDVRLTAMSMCIAIAAAYAANSLAAHIKDTRGGAALGWLVAGAVSLGTGIWAVHFIGMLALQLPIVIAFDASRALATWVLAVLVSGGALWAVSGPRLIRLRFLIGSALLGGGMAGTFYLGMSAIQVTPRIEYDGFGVAASVLTGGLLSCVALRMALGAGPMGVPRKWLGRLLSAVALAFSVTIVHHIGLRAGSLAPEAICTVDPSTISTAWLAVIVAFGSLGVLGVTTMAAIFDAHLASTAQRNNDALRRANDELVKLASHDALTGLPNRTLLTRRIEQAINGASVGTQAVPFALVFVDLDGFKGINDTLGHHVGDRVLCQVAERLSIGMRPRDTLARLGGDEFVLLLRDVEDIEYAVRMTDQLRERLTPTIKIAGHQINVTATFGISLYPAHGSSAQDLLVSADQAMYRGKRAGRNRLEWCDQAVAA